MRPRRAARFAAPALAAALAAALAGCSPVRLGEAARVLADLDAGPGPSALKAETPPPARTAIRYAGATEAREGDLYVPGEPERAAVLLVPGATPKGRDDPRLIDFAATLARARLAVLVPEIPGLRDLRIGAENAPVIADGLAYLRARAAGRPVGLIAVSYGTGPALLALRDIPHARADLVLTIGGYHGIAPTLAFVTTGQYREAAGEPWRHRPPNEFAKWVFVRSNLHRIADARDRTALWAMADRRLDDPGAAIDDLAAGLGPEGAAIYALLANRDPDRVPALIAALPPAVREAILALDLDGRPLDGLPGRFLIVHGRDDPIIPASESVALARALPAQRTALHVLDSLNHVEPQPAGLADRLRLLAVIERVLAWRDGA